LLRPNPVSRQKSANPSANVGELSEVIADIVISPGQAKRKQGQKIPNVISVT
jgi:hypothetical protein